MSGAGSVETEAELGTRSGSGEPDPAEVGAEPASADAEAADAAGAEAAESEAAESEPDAESDGEPESDGDGSGGSSPPPSAGAGRPGGGSWWRERRIVVPAVVAVLSLSLAAVLIVTGGGGSSGDGGDEAGDLGALPAMPSTTIDTGGIEVPTPDGWTAAPVPDLDFGIALPPAWEAVVLRQEMLASLGRSDPAVTGFVEAARAAAESGAVFYAAGEDDQGRVTDLKVRAAPQSGITDEAGLETYARELSVAAGAPDAPIEPVDGAEHPALRYELTTTAESHEGERITTTGIETLVLGPGDIVWSLIVTGEDADLVAELAPEILSTLTLVE